MTDGIVAGYCIAAFLPIAQNAGLWPVQDRAKGETRRVDKDLPGEQPDRGAAGNEGLHERSEGLRPVLKRYFARKGIDPAESDDLVQEVFLRIVKRGHSDALERFEGYVFATAASVLADRARRRSARHADRHVAFDPETHGTADSSMEEASIARQELRATTLILMELPERTRTVFLLRRLEGMSYSEIGIRLGLSISSVEKHVLRAARHLVARSGGAS